MTDKIVYAVNDFVAINKALTALENKAIPTSTPYERLRQSMFNPVPKWLDDDMVYFFHRHIVDRELYNLAYDGMLQFDQRALCKIVPYKILTIPIPMASRVMAARQALWERDKINWRNVV